MTIHHKPSSSSQKKVPSGQPGVSPAKLQWLGPSDNIPDESFPAFLQIMHTHFPDLAYSREAAHYARFYRKNDNPLDPRVLPLPDYCQGTRNNRRLRTDRGLD